LVPFQNFHTSLVFVLGPRLIFGWYEADKYIPDTEIGLPFLKHTNEPGHGIGSILDLLKYQPHLGIGWIQD
jgi:hypothetical protein